jgi:hypothetical protein
MDESTKLDEFSDPPACKRKKQITASLGDGPFIELLPLAFRMNVNTELF